jgi:uncharacterized membrane protein
MVFGFCTVPFIYRLYHTELMNFNEPFAFSVNLALFMTEFLICYSVFFIFLFIERYYYWKDKKQENKTHKVLLSNNLTTNEYQQKYELLKNLLNQKTIDNNEYKQKIADLRTEMMARINQAEKNELLSSRKANLQRAFDEGILTKEEFDKKVKELDN